MAQFAKAIYPDADIRNEAFEKPIWSRAFMTWLFPIFP
jgi:hypothetical protein